MLEDLDLPPVTLEAVCETLQPVSWDQIGSYAVVNGGSEFQMLFEEQGRFILHCVHFAGADWTLDVTKARKRIGSKGGFLGCYDGVCTQLGSDGLWKTDLEGNGRCLFNPGECIEKAILSQDGELLWASYGEEVFGVRNALFGLIAWNMEGYIFFQGGELCGYAMGIDTHNDLWYYPYPSGILSNVTQTDYWYGKGITSSIYVSSIGISLPNVLMYGYLSKYFKEDKWLLLRLSNF